MQQYRQPITLEARRYGVLDSCRICFRSAPVAAFFYAFFDISTAAITPVRTLVVAGFIDSAISAVQNGDDLRRVYLYLFGIVLIAAYQWLKVALHNFADLRLVLSLRERYRTALTEKRTRLAYRHIENPESCDLIERVAANPEGGRLKLAYFHLIDMLSFIVKVGGLLVILIHALWWGGIAVVAVSALTLVTGVRGGRKQYQAERAVSRIDRRTTYLTSLLTGRDPAAERTLFGFTGWASDLWQRHYRQGLGVRISARLRWYVSAYAGNLVTLGSWVFMMVILLRPLQTGAISVGLFIALTQAFTNLDIVWGFVETVHGLAADGEFFKDLTAFLAMEEAHRSVEGRDEPNIAHTHLSTDNGGKTAGKTSTVGGEARRGFSGVEFRDVRFRYPGTDRLILDGVSCRFEPGRHYAIVGENGAGKTTLIKLMTGLYPQDSGQILLDGRGIEDHDSLVPYFSPVYQESARYHLTLRDNILLGRRPAISHEDDRENQFWCKLLSSVGLTEIVDRLAKGLDTPLGKLERDGVDLSDGEWQRVAMARAVAVDAPVRIFDEPAASLDPIAESRLYRMFDEVTAGQTTILISHRLGATRIADTILVLDAGRIVESGSHDELMDQRGLYHRMFESQRGWYE